MRPANTNPAAPMRIPITIFHDVLCAYSALTAQRLRTLEAELPDLIQVSLRPYPLRPLEARPSEKELRRFARHVRAVSRQPEGAGFGTGLWLGGDPPLSSMPPLVALEAALLQGRDAQQALLDRLHTAAFCGGLNVARRDVLLEIASSVGLSMPRFVAAFDSPATTHAIEFAHHDAMARGIRALPAVVIGDDWLMTGVRELAEYREGLERWLSRFSSQPARIVH
jgi:predicted DsbA family dithiol-disulfide isomerase